MDLSSPTLAVPRPAAPSWQDRALQAHAAAEAARRQAELEAALAAKTEARTQAVEHFARLMAAAEVPDLYDARALTPMRGAPGDRPDDWALPLDSGYLFTLSNAGDDPALALYWECPRDACHNLIYGGTFTTLAALGEQLGRLGRSIRDHSDRHAGGAP